MSWLGNIPGRLYRGEVSIDFVGRKKLWYLISGAILLVSVAALGVRGLAFSLDFTGGSQFKVSAPHTSTSQLLRIVQSNDGGIGATAQHFTPTFGANRTPYWLVQTPKLGPQPAGHVQAILDNIFGSNNVAVQTVGPSWGSQISQKAAEALIAFLIVIVIYLSVAFEWRMASAALVALLHDIVITIGVYALTGFQVSPATLIGLLTILGYSLYDTVVVFDKVRENTAGLLGTRRSSYSGAANLALNQTLVRSINTSLIALLPVASILVVAVNLLGNGELKDLSLVLFVGMLSGTYSSICIATPVLCDLKERESDYKQLARQVAQRAVSTKRKAKVAVGPAATAGAAAAAEPEAAARPAGPGESDDQDETAGPATAAVGQVSRPAQRPRPSGAAQRQQPRRPSSARRPAGKKKRR